MPSSSPSSPSSSSSSLLPYIIFVSTEEEQVGPSRVDLEEARSTRASGAQRRGVGSVLSSRSLWYKIQISSHSNLGPHMCVSSEPPAVCLLTRGVEARIPGQLLDTGCPGRPGPGSREKLVQLQPRGSWGRQPCLLGGLMSECLPLLFSQLHRCSSHFYFFCCNCKYTFFFVNLKYFLSLTDVTIIVNMICFHFSLLFDLQDVEIS